MWKEKCALDLCPPEIQSALQHFAHSRFFRFAAAYCQTTNTHDPNALTPCAAEAWHWFETYLQLRKTREGKVYKEWLFARKVSQDGTTGLDVIQGGATVLMRDVVRERLRREFSSRTFSALDAPINVGGGNQVTLHDLLPETDGMQDAVEQRELESMAELESKAFLASINRRERIAFLAHELGLSLANPTVTTLAGCGKSVLSTAFNGVLHGVAGQIRSRHPMEDKTTLINLTIASFDHLKKDIMKWGKSEKTCSQLFILVEGS